MQKAERHLSVTPLSLGMEPAGIEPASTNRSLSASTCVFRCSVFSSGRRPTDSLFRTSQEVSRLGVSWHHPTGQPDFVVASSLTSGTVRLKTGA